MDYLLLVGYGSIFLALVVYVFYLRSKLRTLEQQVADLTAGEEEAFEE